MEQEKELKGQVLSSENVARILSKEWFVRGKLNSIAFTLDLGETYLSVNRTAIESFKTDVENFVSSHQAYSFGGGDYKLSLLNVGEIRAIDVNVGDTNMNIDVEVEPRNTHTKSHAGIFTRFQNKNIKRGQLIKAVATAEEISTDSILLEVRSELLRMSTIEVCKMGTESDR